MFYEAWFVLDWWETLILDIFLLFAFGVWVWSLIKVIQKKDSVLWIIILVFVPVIGTWLYFFIKKPYKKTKKVKQKK